MVKVKRNGGKRWTGTVGEREGWGEEGGNDGGARAWCVVSVQLAT
jgi:hypothetical protein